MFPPLLTKERCTTCSAVPVSKSIHDPLPADDCMGRLELPGGIEAGVNKFLSARLLSITAYLALAAVEAAQ